VPSATSATPAGPRAAATRAALLVGRACLHVHGEHAGWGARACMCTVSMPMALWMSARMCDCPQPTATA